MSFYDKLLEMAKKLPPPPDCEGCGQPMKFAGISDTGGELYDREGNFVRRLPDQHWEYFRCEPCDLTKSVEKVVPR